MTPPSDPGERPEAATGPGHARVRGRLAVALLAFVLIGVPAAGLTWSLLGQASDSKQPTGGTPDGAGFDQPVSEYPTADRGAPVELAGTTLTGEHLDLADLSGQVLVINVWGSWCAPCRTEAPVLAELSGRYADRGVAFVGVNVKDNRAAALAFEQTYGIIYPSIEDRDGQAILALSRHVPAPAVPVTLVLDTEGRVAARVLGAVREATLRALLDSVLREAA